MFYLKLKDGDSFLTDADSNDIKEFERILDVKLGSDAAEIFRDLIIDESAIKPHILVKLKLAIYSLTKAIESDELDKHKLNKIVDSLNKVYKELTDEV